MTRDLCTVAPVTEFKDIAALLTREAISAVPVVDAEGTLRGVVSEADLLPKEEYVGAPHRPSRFSRKRAHKADALRARDLMTAPVWTVDIGTPLPDVARELVRGGMRRLFVLDEGKLVGVVARRDLLGVFLRPDQDLCEEIRSEVFERALLADPGCYSVTVASGVVTLLGRLERRSAVTAAGELAALVPGVVDICNRLDYVWDDERA
ncbi:CBS domain-containing protein [Amycolatopsis sp. RM579]|uniref:CBS domain-containing protein n=2 Tax=Amycolatopsis pithecellobii TaxID=664692 RepID=A0A6N7Z5B1_9PSEU|nr:CBS domain-containing protein [Amycolatopsis pithecellobii]